MPDTAIAEPPVKPSLPPAPAPASKPSPAPPPAPAQKPTTPEPVVAEHDDDDPFKELDAKVFSKKAPEPPKPSDKPQDKPAEKATVPDDDQYKGAPKPLRDELKRVKEELKAKETSISDLQHKMEDFESKGKDTTALAERLAAKEKELETIQGELRAAKAEMSPEFKAQWDEPFNNAAEYAKNLIQRLRVGKWAEVEDATTGEKRREWQTTSQADFDKDFAGLFHMAKDDPAGAMEKAEGLYGKSAPIVVEQLNTLLRLDYNRNIALAKEKAQWKERETAKQAEAAQFREQHSAAIATIRQEIKQARAELYGDDPNDPEGNEILAASQKLFEQKGKTFNEMVKIQVRNRLNAESFMREVHRNKLLREENEVLKAQIEEMKGTKPGPGTRTSTPSAPSNDDDAMSELKSIKFDEWKLFNPERNRGSSAKGVKMGGGK